MANRTLDLADKKFGLLTARRITRRHPFVMWFCDCECGGSKEVRGSELLAMVQALNTGHKGGGATIHANSFESISERVGALGWQCGLPAEEMVSQVRGVIDYVIFIGVEDGVRKVQKIGPMS